VIMQADASQCCDDFGNPDKLGRPSLQQMASIFDTSVQLHVFSASSLQWWL